MPFVGTVPLVSHLLLVMMIRKGVCPFKRSRSGQWWIWG